MSKITKMENLSSAEGKHHEEYQYLGLMQKILEVGTRKTNRTGIDTLSLFGNTMRFTLRDNILPLLTTKKMFWRGIVEELLFFIRGNTDAKLLKEKKVNIWDQNTSRAYLDKVGLSNYEEGDMGPCFPLDTLILTDGGYKYVQDVSVNDMLYTHRARWRHINGIYKRTYSGAVYTIYLAYGPESISATKEHPFLWVAKVDDEPEWKKIKDIKFGYLMINYQIFWKNANADDYLSQLTWFKLGLNSRVRKLVSGTTRFEILNGKVISRGNTIYYPIIEVVEEQVSSLNVMNFSVEEDESYVVQNVTCHNCYGFQWRHFGAEYKGCQADYTNQGYDQLGEAIRLIKQDPNSRRIVVSAWNPPQLNKMVLPPCHMIFQFDVEIDAEGVRHLSCLIYQRSADVPLGVPFNIASYALLTHIVAQATNTQAKELIYVTGDTHIYENQIPGCREQLKRQPYSFPRLKIVNFPDEGIEKLTPENFLLSDWKQHPSIEFPFAT